MTRIDADLGEELRLAHNEAIADFPDGTPISADTASLNVDTAHPTGALGLYERAGFRQSYRQDPYHLDE